MPKLSYARLQFQVEAQLGHGESLFVVGDCSALGDSDPSSGIQLFTSPADYPKWTSDQISVAANRVINYHYVVFSGSRLSFEESVRRTVQVKKPNQVVVDILGVAPEAATPTSDRAAEEAEKDAPAAAALANSFTFADDEESTTGVVINREDADATASSVGSTPINAKPFTPHLALKPSGSHAALRQEPPSKGTEAAGGGGGGGSGGGGSGSGSASSPSAFSQKSSYFLDPSEVSISSSDGVIVVAYFLPVIVTRLKEVGTDESAWSIEWDIENLLSLRTRLRVTWVGTVRMHQPPTSPQEQDSLARALKRIDCVPVWVDPAVHTKFYKTFCKGTLWPIFHHILDIYGPRPTRFWDQRTQEDVWQSYSQVNMRFREKIVEVYNDGDLIWIHGFHLLVLPSFITKTIPKAKTALFLHTPFPSSEIFRTLSVREDLLRGMLNADHIGFHLFEYARHFVTCVRRILGLTYDMEGGQLAVHYNGRTVAISSIHVGVDISSLRSMLLKPEVEVRLGLLQEGFRGRKVVLGIDRLERIRGLPLKLLAYEHFLKKYPQWHDKVVLYQVGITASERGDDCERTRKEVLDLVQRINDTYRHLSSPPVIFEEKDEGDVRLQERLPLYALADVFLVSSPRDGLNRMPLEFVAAHERKIQQQQEKQKQGEGGGSSATAPPPPYPGVLMLSEFVSCTRVLLGALFVNPWKVVDMADMLDRALGMPAEERLARHQKDSDFVNTHTVLQWAYQILMDLKRVRKDFDRSYYSGVGLGLGFRVLGMESGFNQLEAESVCRAYRQSRYRVIMADYGGTLVADNEKTDMVQYYAVSNKLAQRKGPAKGLLESLSDITTDLKNMVFVVTGKEKSFLEQFFANIPNLGLGAEHGFYFRWPHSHTTGADGTCRWDTMLPTSDSSWMELARAIMDVYVKRTHGTYIEQKESALLWQYRDADPEFGHMQSKELEDHLNGVLRGYPVEVLRGENHPMQGGYIEVRHENVSKGAFLERVLNRMMEQGKQVDFVLCIGDDPSDENMFAAAEAYGAKYPSLVHTFTCTVGKKPSHARSFVNDVDEVHAILASVARAARSAHHVRGHQSSIDLRHHTGSPMPISPCSSTPNSASGGLSRSSSMKHSLSMTDMHDFKRTSQSPPPVDGALVSPTSAMTWATYVKTIEEGNETDGIFF